MPTSRVASRYASALLTSALQANILDDVRKDVHVLRTALTASRELLNVLKSPIVRYEQKKQALTNIFADKLAPLTMHFLLLLLDKRREGELPSILAAFNELYNQHKGIVEVKVLSAVELDDAQKNAILDKVKRYTGKSVVPSYSIDKALIGGFLVKMGDTVLDGTVKHQLENLKKALADGVLSN